MKINYRKLEIILAEQCASISELRDCISPKTLHKAKLGNDILPASVGRIAHRLGVPVQDIIEEED